MKTAVSGAGVRSHLHAELLAGMEASGQMDRRREEIKEWFAANPAGTPLRAVQALGYSFPDHMHVVADSIWYDLRREAPA